MKYLDMLKEEIQLHDDQENQKNTHPELPQKPPKGLYGVFGVREGSTFSEKTNKEKCQKCDQKEELPPHGSGCNHTIKGYYKKQWSRLDVLEDCPRGLWN